MSISWGTILNSVLQLVDATVSTFGQGMTTSPGSFANYTTNPLAPHNLATTPLTPEEIKQGNQIMLGIIGAAAIGVVVLYTTTRKHAA